jgi:hypothetical protein
MKIVSTAATAAETTTNNLFIYSLFNDAFSATQIM